MKSIALRITAHLLAAVALASTASAAVIDVSGLYNNPNSEIGVGNTANLIGNTTFGWMTGTTTIPATLNGYKFTLDSGNGNAYNYGGDISGAGDVRFLMGPYSSGFANAPMYLSGSVSNTYTGTSYVDKGRVVMQKTGGAIALPGNVVIGGQGANDRLRWGEGNQVGDSAIITLRDNFVATLDLNGFNDTIYAINIGSNGVIETGTGGTLVTTAVNHNGAWLAPGTYDSSSLSFIQGTGTLEVLGGESLAGKIIGLNFAGANNNPGSRKALGASTEAGAPGFRQTNWNNTFGTAQVGTPSSANDTVINLIDDAGFASTLDVTFTSGQTWGHNFGANPTGDQMLNGNGITDGSPNITISDIPFNTYDVVVYVGMYDTRDGMYTLTIGGDTYERFVSSMTWGEFDGEGWMEISDLATSAGARERGNYMIFRGLSGSSFTLSSTGVGINAIQIVQTPEPSTWVLSVLGLVALLAIRRRQARG